MTGARAREWLRQRGADGIAHPGGTLYDHLGRVHDRLGELGAGPDLCLAGLTHAAYGTDGFDVALLDVAERATLRDLVGDDAEALVYRYGACDRGRSWPALADSAEVTDRFTGTVHRIDPAELRALVDLSIVNEVDVVAHNPAALDRHGPALRRLFAAWSPVASPAVAADARRVLGGF
ncbi:DUF6817 domain-containing protein [Plantactinospora siamensis]|uniref:DUF6817 domain-containing protein n=1 Tax=Plantactinospora siamensis TaxID=555372 RepID=A0ABV6P2G2_9ACTN